MAECTHLEPEHPSDGIEQPGLLNRVLMFRTPCVQAPDDHADRRQVDGRAHTRGRDEMAGPRLADPGGIAALADTGRRRDAHDPAPVARS